MPVSSSLEETGMINFLAHALHTTLSARDLSDNAHVQ